jgi:ribosome-associated protein
VVRRQLRTAVQAAMAKKAVDPVILDLRQVADFCDYFVICGGSNPHQVEAIAEAIELVLTRAEGLQPAHREGGRGGGWVVLDYLDFIVHVFSAEARQFYNLERLWSAAERLPAPKSVKDSISSLLNA